MMKCWETATTVLNKTAAVELDSLDQSIMGATVYFSTASNNFYHEQIPARIELPLSLLVIFCQSFGTGEYIL